jgi:hypothetical protein
VRSVEVQGMWSLTPAFTALNNLKKIERYYVTQRGHQTVLPVHLNDVTQKSFKFLINKAGYYVFYIIIFGVNKMVNHDLKFKNICICNFVFEGLQSSLKLPSCCIN